jgi:hypothetical protein
MTSSGGWWKKARSAEAKSIRMNLSQEASGVVLADRFHLARHREQKRCADLDSVGLVRLQFGILVRAFRDLFRNLFNFRRDASEGASGCAPKTQFSAIYDPVIVS